MRLAICACLVLGLPTAHSAAQAGSDVWVVDLRIANGALVAEHPRNLTQRPGYDNQPSFTADGRAVFFTSIREDAQADIWRVPVAGGTAENITRTPESEYSALVTPDGGHISVIRVERDSTQRLWRFPLQGNAAPSLVLTALRPVGYHVWITERLLATFVLGSPNALVLVDAVTERADTLSRSIGRAFAKVPGREAFSYLQMVRDSSAWITEIDARSHATRRIAPAPARSDYHVWTPTGMLITAAGSELLMWREGAWHVFADLSAHGITGISRLAISPSGDRLAFVADD